VGRNFQGNFKILYIFDHFFRKKLDYRSFNFNAKIIQFTKQINKNFKIKTFLPKNVANPNGEIVMASNVYLVALVCFENL